MKFSLQGFWAVGKETFTNGDLSIVTVPTQVGADAYDITGWTIYNRQIFLNGQSTIDGWPTPADATRPASNFSSDLNTASGSYASSYGFSGDIPAGLPAGTRSMQLTSEGNTINNAFGIIRGPYMVSNDALNLESGNTVEFWWRAAGTGDAYDVYGYLLNVANGDTVELLNDTGTSTGSGTAWKKESIVLPSGKSGTYKFVFVSGSYDLSGGRYVGASLFITGSVLQRTIYPPSVEVTVNPMLQAEGDAVTATITTANIGSNIYHWTVIPSSGDVTADDFESGALSGSVVIDVDSQQKGTASINVAARKDRKNEGIETFNIQIEVGDFNRHVIYNSATAITITEPPPGFTIDTAGVTSVDEGSSITAYVSTFENYAIGTYYVTLLPVTGNVDLLDLDSQNLTVELQPDQFGNATAPVSVTISSDFKTEGPETFKLQLRQNSAAGTVLATTQEIITINDTSRGFVVDAKSADETMTVDEGDNVLVNITVPENIGSGKFCVVVTDVDNPDASGITGTYGDFYAFSAGFNTIAGPGATFSIFFTIKADYVTEGDRRIRVDVRHATYWNEPDMGRPLLGSSEIITVRDTCTDRLSVLSDRSTGPGIINLNYSDSPADVIFIKFTYKRQVSASMVMGYRIIAPDVPNSDGQYTTYTQYNNSRYGIIPGMFFSSKRPNPIYPTFDTDTFAFSTASIDNLIPFPAPAPESPAYYIAFDFVAAWLTDPPSDSSGITAHAEFYRTNGEFVVYSGDDIAFNYGNPLPIDSMNIASVPSLPRGYPNWQHVVRFVYNIRTGEGYFRTNI